MTPPLTAFERSLDGGRGLARGLRIRRALEEAGQPHGVRLLSFAAPAHAYFPQCVIRAAIRNRDTML